MITGYSCGTGARIGRCCQNRYVQAKSARSAHAHPQYQPPARTGFIEEMLEAGEYRNATEAMSEAIRALQQRRAMDALKLERLRRSIDTGLADLDRGDYEEVDSRA